MVRGNEEDLEVSKRVEAQCSDLQDHVVLLCAEREECQFREDDLSVEVSEKAGDLEKAEFARWGLKGKRKLLR